MKSDIILVKYGEIYLKGLNRPQFMRALVQRVRQSLEGTGAEVTLHDARILVRGYEDRDEAVLRIRKVFGVHSVCPAVEMDKEDFNAVLEAAAEMMSAFTGTFKVDARRSDKHYFLDTPGLNARIGEYILENAGGSLTVDVRKPDHVLRVEIRDKAYLYSQGLPAAGGVPGGSGG